MFSASLSPWCRQLVCTSHCNKSWLDKVYFVKYGTFSQVDFTTTQVVHGFVQVHAPGWSVGAPWAKSWQLPQEEASSHRAKETALSIWWDTGGGATTIPCRTISCHFAPSIHFFESDSGIWLQKKMEWLMCFVCACVPQTKSAPMVSSASSTIQSGQTSLTGLWLMNWERKPRFLPAKKRTSAPRRRLDPFSLILGPHTTPGRMPKILKLNISKGKVPLTQVRSVKTLWSTGMIPETVLFLCRARQQETATSRSGQATIITTPTSTLALAPMRTITLTIPITSTTPTCTDLSSSIKVPFVAPDISQTAAWSRAGAAPRRGTVTGAWSPKTDPSMTLTLLTWSQLTIIASPVTTKHQITQSTGRTPSKASPARSTPTPGAPTAPTKASSIIHGLRRRSSNSNSSHLLLRLTTKD